MAALCLLCGACGPARENGVLGTVDLGDDFVAPQLQLDDAFFYCKIQPQVLSKYGCATGRSDEKGGCHDSRSALRLIATDAPAPCDKNGAVIGAVPDAYKANFEAVRFEVQSDPLNSPLYLRPLNRASHPRAIFSENDEAAQLIVQWIAGANR
ncbi:MAG: hypothetical protein ACHQ53_04355 [Polyangiales bacterium]